MPAVLNAVAIRRLNRRLEALESRLSDLRHRPEPDHHLYTATQRKHHQERREADMAAVEAQIAEAEGRLRSLHKPGRPRRIIAS